MGKKCAICNGRADKQFKRVEVWSDERWRLTMSTYIAVKGFCYLEPKRHIPYVTELNGIEAAELGPKIAKAARAVKGATDAKLVYVYIYGDHIPHLHIHLAPHVDGDVYANDVVRSDVKLDRRLMKSEEVRVLSTRIAEGLKGPTATL